MSTLLTQEPESLTTADPQPPPTHRRRGAISIDTLTATPPQPPLITTNEPATMSSLFGGGNAAGQSGGSSLFGNSTTQNPSSGGGGLFGNAGSQQQGQSGGGGLFGNSTTGQQSQGGGLFGASTTQQQQPQQQQGGGLFGAPATNQNNHQQQSGGPFGASTTTQNTQQPQQSTGLFGATLTTQNQQQQQPSTSLFGGASNTQQPPQATNTSSLFSNPSKPTSLFPQQPQQTNNLFASSAAAAQTQQNNQSNFQPQSSLFSNPGNASTALQSSTQHQAALSHLQTLGLSTRPSNEKPLINQIQTLIRKWDPNSTDTLLQKYLYNAVKTSYAPFYYPNPGEREEEWESALSSKPAPLTGEAAGGEEISFVPVLVRGFRALGERVEYQARTVNEMRARLHEMNNSLDAVMRKHQQSISVRIENARRQHAALSQRCLRLAVKASILRNRGYPLDAAEEGLRRTLLDLEKRVFDPQIAAREEMVWARMVSLRERGRWLEEMKRVGGEQGLGGESGNGGGSGGVSEEVLKKTRKILRDYDEQLLLLGRELEGVRGEFGEFEGRIGR